MNTGVKFISEYITGGNVYGKERIEIGKNIEKKEETLWKRF